MSNDIIARNRSLKTSLVLTGFGWALFAAMSFYFGRTFVGYVELTIASINWILFLLYQSRPEKMPKRVQYAVGISVMGIFVITNISDHCRSSPIVWFYVLAPLAVSMQVSIRSGIMWAMGTLGMGLLNMIVPPIFPELGFEFSSLEHYIGYGIFFVLITWLAIEFRGMNDRVILRIQDREKELKKVAEELRAQTVQLEIARDEALEATKVKSLFLANMSHEIRTPLNGVLGMSSVLLDTELSREQRTFAKTISKSGSALLSVINEILDFSKLEAGLVQLEIVPFDLYECVDDVLDIFGHEVERKEIDLAGKINSTVPRFVQGDLTRVRQILVNLVGNAVKFTEIGEVIVVVELTKDGKIKFEVKDTGIGIPPEKRGELFKDFSQVDASTTRRFGGTGLGLAISRRLVEFMDGEIWFESESGKGSSFFFKLQLDEVVSPMRQTIERLSLTNRTCVVVGRNITSKKVLCDRLQMWGMSVNCVDDFSQMMHFLAENTESPELVILTEQDDHSVIVSALQNFDENIDTIMVLSVTSGLDQFALDQLGIASIYRPIRFRQLRQLVESILGGWARDTNASLSIFDPQMASRIPLSILIAEDNATNRQVALSMFRRLGYQVEAVENGAEALEILEKKPFDIIFMDIHMPVLDGVEATIRIREKYKEGPWIVALSASVLDTQRKEARLAGMDDFLGKPYEVNNLIRAIERFVSDTHVSISHDEIVLHVQRDEQALDALEDLFPNNPDKFHKLIQQHIENGSRLYEQIVDAIETRSHSDLKFAAHSLKSSSAMFGSIAVSKICNDLESAAVAQEPFTKTIIFEKKKLDSAWKSAIDYLRTIILYDRD